MKKRKNHPQALRDAAFPQIAETAAATECTGLMPVAPQTMAEWEAYKALFSTEMSEDEFWHRK